MYTVYILRSLETRGARNFANIFSFVVARTTPATAESVVQFVDIQDCASLADGIYADPTDCHRYYHCYSGKTYYFRCYEGFVFHPCQLKCAFRDACISPESCRKTNRTTDTTAKWSGPPIDDQFSSSEIGTTRIGHIAQKKLLRLAHSNLVNDADDVFSTITVSNNDLEEEVTVTNATPTELTTTETVVHNTKPVSKKHIPALNNEIESTSSVGTVGTTEATMTYIVKVVFARRNQPGIQGNELEQTVESYTTVPVAKTTILEATDKTPIAKLDNRVEENPDVTVNETDANSVISETGFPTRVNFTAEFNATLNHTSDLNLNNSLSVKFLEEFNISSAENVTEFNRTTIIHLNSTLSANETNELKTSKLRNSTLHLNESSVDLNETLPNTLSSAESELSATNESGTVILESNAIDQATVEPARNFLKNKQSSKEKNKSAEDTTEEPVTFAETTTSESVESETTTENNFTLALVENATSHLKNENGSLSFNLSANETSKEAHLAFVEANSTSTFEFATSKGESKCTV